MAREKKPYRSRRGRDTGPKPIANVLSQIMTRKGLGRQLSRTLLHDSWPKAVGEPWAKYTQVGALRRGVLEVLVDNSTFVQELGFRKEEILKTLRRLVPDEYITDLRFRVGPIYTS